MSRFRSPGWKTPSPSRAPGSSSIRGKISAPIPIADDDDEFPIRSPGAGIATPLGHEGIEKQLRLTPPRPQRDTTPQPEEDQVATEPMEPTRAAPEVPPESRLSYEIPARQTTEINLGLVARGSTATPASELDKPERKKSTLRSVLGRLFGKKRKSGGTVSGKAAGTARHAQHHSDPTALRGLKDQETPQKRSASMPINEFNRALRSHSVIADDNNLLQGQDRKSSSPADRRTSRPRRATTPSRIYTPTGGPGKDWGLAPRPASGHVRASHSFGNLNAHEPIGYAVTSGSHPNRRSRSLGHLRAYSGFENEVRRRSDEIKYWRESYDPDALSPMSSQKPEGEAPVLIDDNDNSEEPESKQPPLPFNFGPLGEMAGMKITQAASLESRVSRLEERLQSMERAVGILHNRASGGHLLLQDPPRSQKQKSWTRPGTDSSEMSLPAPLPHAKLYQQAHNPQADTVFTSMRSQESSRPSTTSTQRSYHQSYEELSPRPVYASSPEQTPQMPSNANLSVSHSEMARPLSTSTTIRGIASSSPDRSAFPLSKHGSLTAHHYSALLNLIQAESAARQHLEAQVLTLQHQLHAALSGSAIPYPTPSPDRRINSRATGGDFLAFEQGESDSESDGGDAYEATREEEFLTPSEERDHYVSQEDYEREMGLVEGQPRTLSLSQMTLKKGLQSVNF